MANAKAVAAKTAKMLSALPKQERRNAVESLRRLIEQEIFDLSLRCRICNRMPKVRLYVVREAR